MVKMAMEGEGMTEGYWVIRTYTAGVVGEKIKYWVPGEKADAIAAKAQKRHQTAAAE